MLAAGSSGDITRLSGALKRGDAEARSELARLVYAELRARAAYCMRGERSGHTLQPTALVNETCLRLLQDQTIERHAVDHPQIERMLILDQALTRLAEMDAGQAALVEMIYFGGLTQEEAAAALGISSRTVKRNRASARAWLQAELSRPLS
jgi:hypothetical protein